MERMTITKGLAELKLLDGRIQKAISSTSFVTSLQNGKKINSRLTIEEYNKLALSGLASINDLKTRRESIKKAIVMSNANTSLTIGGITLTVAEAIERKSSIGYDELLLNTIKSQLRMAEASANKGNEEADKKAMEAMNNALGKEGSKNPKEEDIEAIYKPIYSRYKFEVVDPISVGKFIEDLEKNIDTFKMNVDFELSTSNATTFIEI